MADKIDLKKLRTVGDVIAALKSLKNESLTNDSEFLLVCHQIFEKLGILGELDVTNPIESAKKLEDLKDKPLIEILENTEVVEPEIVLESRALNKQDLKVLLDEYDKHRELKEAEKLAFEISKNKHLKGISQHTILEAILKKIELEAKLAEKGETPQKADKLSDQILETELTVEAIVGIDKITPEDAIKLAEEIVIAANESKDTKEAIKSAEKIKFRGATEDANEVLAELVETKRAASAFDNELEKIVEKAVNKIEVDGEIRLTQIKKDEIRKLIAERLEVIADNPIIKIDDPELGVTVTKTEGVKTQIKELPLSWKIRGVIGTPLPTKSTETIEKVVEGVGKESTELWKPDNNSAGKKIDKIISAFAEKGAGAEQIKQLMALRFASTKPGIEGIEEAVTQEYKAEVQMQKDGFADNKIVESVEQANVIKAMLKSQAPISKSIELINKSKEILAGNKDVKAVLDVAGTLTKNKKLLASMEMVRKLVNFQERLDKMTGGVFSKFTGNAMVQVGRIMGVESLQTFGLAILNKMGLEAMATHIATFGLEGGIKSMLVQVFKTGTVTALKAGTVVAAETAAAGAMQAIASVLTGPGGWLFLAATLALEAGKAVVGKIYGVARDMFGKVLETLGIGSAETIESIKNGLKKIVEVGGKGLLAVGTFIVGLPALLASGSFAIVGSVMVIVLAGLIGYNLFQTASTQISSLVAPQIPEQGGVCVNTGKPKSGASGPINCDQSVPDQSGTSVDKQNFIRVAEAWRSGGGKNAELCFNDVVKRANAAGVNADYALWAWLHESGASNYASFGTVEDFGIHGQSSAPPNNFDLQITYFLKLDPGSKCLGQPGIGSDYWLSFATNYLTGGCDPNVYVGNFNGFLYKAEMVATWGWIAGAPMPSSIRSSSGGSGSGPDKKFESIVDSDGSVLICEIPSSINGSNPGTIALPTLDPSIKIPEGCPAMRPVSGGFITQGPMAPGCSHANMPNAIDFGVPNGTAIVATHDGIARIGSNSIYGVFVDVTGSCNGVTFSTRYAHMPQGGPTISNNMVVIKGQQIGVVDNTGSSTGPHLHYDFRYSQGLPNISASIGSSVDLTGCCNGGATSCPNK